MERDPRASDSRHLVYREKSYPIIGIPLAVLGLLLLSGSAFSYVMRWLHDMPLFGEHGFQAHLAGLIVEVVIFGIGWKLATSRRLVFDMARGMVFKSTRLLPWQWTTAHGLEEFDSVCWRPHRESDKDGAHTVYPVTLTGPGKELDLFEEADQDDALKSVADIANFLGFEQKQGEATGQRPLAPRAGLRVLTAFSYFWYVFCSVPIVAGLSVFVFSCIQLIRGQVGLGEGLSFIGISLVFTCVAIGFVFIGRHVFRKGREALQAAATAAGQRMAEAADARPARTLRSERAIRGRTRPQVRAGWTSFLSKLAVGAIPFFVFAFIVWNMFHDPELPTAEKPNRDTERADVAREWSEALRSHEERLTSTRSGAARYGVHLRGRQGQEIKGEVDTARDTFVIHSWRDPQKRLWTPQPDALPITLHAFDADGRLADVPADWSGELEGWAFLLPPVEDLTTIAWEQGAPIPLWRGASFGWGGLRNRLGNISVNRGRNHGTRQFEYVPYRETGMSSIDFDEVTVTRLTPNGRPIPQLEAEGAVQPPEQLATQSKVTATLVEAPEHQAPDAVATADPTRLVAEGTITHVGTPIKKLTDAEPSFWFRNEAVGKEAKPSRVEFNDGTLRVYGLAPGEYGMSVNVNANGDNPASYPGDYRTFQTFRVDTEAVARLDVNVSQIIRLRQPQDNNVVMEGWDPRFTKIAWTSPVVFQWDSLGNGVTYRYSIQRVQTDPWRHRRGPTRGETSDTRIDFALSPSEPNEFYMFQLRAFRGKTPAGMLMTHGDLGEGWDYRFRVISAERE